MRGRYALAPDAGGVRLANKIRSRIQQKPGCAVRAPGFLFSMPRWRKRHTRVSQKHADPGSNPGWGTRFRARANALSPALLQLGCGKQPPPRVASESIGRAAGRTCTNFLAVAQAGSAPRSGRGGRRFDSCRRDQLFLSSSADKRARGYDPRGRGFDSLLRCQPGRRNSEERMPACRAGRRGFKSRRRRHFFPARNSIARVAGSYPEGCRLNSCRADQFAPRSSVGRAPAL